MNNPEVSGHAGWGPGGSPDGVPGDTSCAPASDLIEMMADRRLSIAVAESLTGGLLVAELIRTPGASRVVRGGLVAYGTSFKKSLLGVSVDLLAHCGPVHPEVACQMAEGVRSLFAVDGVAAAIGVSTTGVAGPDFLDGFPPGTAFVGISVGGDARAIELALSGTRDQICAEVVARAVQFITDEVND